MAFTYGRVDSHAPRREGPKERKNGDSNVLGVFAPWCNR